MDGTPGPSRSLSYDVIDTFLRVLSLGLSGEMAGCIIDAAAASKQRAKCSLSLYTDREAISQYLLHKGGL